MDSLQKRLSNYFSQDPYRMNQKSSYVKSFLISDYPDRQLDEDVSIPNEMRKEFNFVNHIYPCGDLKGLEDYLFLIGTSTGVFTYNQKHIIKKIPGSEYIIFDMKPFQRKMFFLDSKGSFFCLNNDRLKSFITFDSLFPHLSNHIFTCFEFGFYQEKEVVYFGISNGDICALDIHTKDIVMNISHGNISNISDIEDICMGINNGRLNVILNLQQGKMVEGQHAHILSADNDGVLTLYDQHGHVLQKLTLFNAGSPVSILSSMSIQDKEKGVSHVVVAEDCGKSQNAYRGLVSFLTIHHQKQGLHYINESVIKKEQWLGKPTCSCTLSSGDFVVGFMSGNRLQNGKIAIFDGKTYVSKRVIETSVPPTSKYFP